MASQIWTYLSVYNEFKGLYEEGDKPAGRNNYAKYMTKAWFFSIRGHGYGHK